RSSFIYLLLHRRNNSQISRRPNHSSKSGWAAWTPTSASSRVCEIFTFASRILNAMSLVFPLAVRRIATRHGRVVHGERLDQQVQIRKETKHGTPILRGGV